MRGKAGWPLCGLPCIGITPAYAGKSQPWRSYSQRRWDHPRVCGEKRPAVDGKRPLRGSPPHVRGKVKDPVPVSALVGITPACAGKRSAQAGAPAGRRDHPRVCGEKCIPLTRGHGRQGSPPRMRGKVQLGEIDLQDIWITPAYAGKSGPCPDRVPPAGDHPRVCGEKSQSTSASPRALGSPPRMRGKGVKQSNSRIRMGITPAYAGKRYEEMLQQAGR